VVESLEGVGDDVEVFNAEQANGGGSLNLDK